MQSFVKTSIVVLSLESTQDMELIQQFVVQKKDSFIVENTKGSIW